MPWNNQSGGGGPWGGGPGRGGGGNGNSPWGRPGGQGGGGGGPTPPDIDEVIRKSQDRLKRMMPRGVGGRNVIALVVVALLVIWGLSGFYRVQPNQQGIELVFGRYTGIPQQPGLHWNWPAPLGNVYLPDVTRENRIEIGQRTVGEGSSRNASVRDIPEESQMITGDENIVDIDFVVFWRISDAGAFLFNLQNPEETIKMAAESVMRDIIGQTKIQVAQTEGRATIEGNTQLQLQGLLDEYASGVEIRQVQLLAVDPPNSVIDAFNEVQRARQDMDRLKNEAEAVRNDIVPRARGEAAQLMEEADAYRQEVVNRAQGDANRFVSVYEAYKSAPDVTTQRIYLETLEHILGQVNKVIIDDQAGGGSGVVPYLPLPEVQKRVGGGSSRTQSSNGSTNR